MARRFLTGRYKPGMSGLNSPPSAHGLAAAVPAAPPELEPPGGSRKETGYARQVISASSFCPLNSSRSAFAVKDSGQTMGTGKGRLTPTILTRSHSLWSLALRLCLRNLIFT